LKNKTSTFELYVKWLTPVEAVTQNVNRCVEFHLFSISLILAACASPRVIAPHPIILLAATEKQAENQGAATVLWRWGEFLLLSSPEGEFFHQSQVLLRLRRSHSKNF
jgi:hypothetical protein